MDFFPTAIALEQGDLVITWNDHKSQKLTARSLRDGCPCANCREKKSATVDAPLNPLSIIPGEEAAPVSIVEMRPVGSYGYSIKFNDGHSTGIYSLQLLRHWDSS